MTGMPRFSNISSAAVVVVGLLAASIMTFAFDLGRIHFMNHPAQRRGIKKSHSSSRRSWFVIGAARRIRQCFPYL